MNHRRAPLRRAARSRLFAAAGITAAGALLAVAIAVQPAGADVPGGVPSDSASTSPAPGASPMPTSSPTPSSTPSGTPTSPAAPQPADTPSTSDDVTLMWAGSAEMQSAPPFGGSDYFSAGSSDGTQATYRAQNGEVSILQQAPDGGLAPASWATRAAHVAGGGRQQLVELSGGHASLAGDGSGSVQWTGSFSVNFYGGLVPFTITDPTLTVDATGDASLTATLSGYASSISDPTAKTPLASRADVTVADFRGVSLDEGASTLEPLYAGVTVSVPPGQTPQNTSGSGWGSWPQSWVDYQFQTGLSSYWYSSGGAADAQKAPSAVTVTIGATTAVPPAPPSPGSGEASTSKPGSGTKAPGHGGTPAKGISIGATSTGYLDWGVKESWRSYITGPIAAGDVTIAKGAKATASGYRFPQAKGSSYSAAKGMGTAAYGGSVRFIGHGGLLDLTFSDPSVKITSTKTATLYLRVGGSAAIGIGAVDLAGATQRTKGGASSFAGAPVTLTAAGAKVFSYGSSVFYPAGTAMDDISFVIGAAATASDGGTTVLGYRPGPKPTMTAMKPPVALQNGCTVQSASLSWGFKESFRAYILSSIANGSWSEAGGASYATPDFGWAAGTGSIAPKGTAGLKGLVKFAGTVHFTGHDGVLSTTIGNPQLDFADATTAYLLLDVSGPTMQGDMIHDTGTSFARLDLSHGAITQAADGTVTGSDIPATLTGNGAIAFPNYPAGTALDPISFTLKLDKDCVVASTHPAAQTTTTAVPSPAVGAGGDEASGDRTAPARATAPLPWRWWVGGLLAALLAGALLLALRRSGTAALAVTAAADADAHGSAPETASKKDRA